MKILGTFESTGFPMSSILPFAKRKAVTIIEQSEQVQKLNSKVAVEEQINNIMI